jgi:hypothetical protein
MADVIRVRARSYDKAKKLAFVTAGRSGYADVGRGNTLLKPTTTSDGIFDFTVLRESPSP